jgi:hypothetical protein
MVTSFGLARESLAIQWVVEGKPVLQATVHSIIVLADDRRGKRRPKPKVNSSSNRTKKRLSWID